MVKFEWDDAKNRLNQRKHYISFETASLVFDDPHALFVQDRIENGELRWQAIGRIADSLVVLVAHTVHFGEHEEIVRIISARRAGKQERKRYEDQTY